MRSSHGWREIDSERKGEILAAIASGAATRGPAHAELDLTDRCNVACYFCNQQDTRTRHQIPIERALRLIDELAEGGVRSVRLSGGGDPLFHKEIRQIFDRLAERGIVIDNLTTNAVALNDEIATRLVAGAAREVIVSLNAADPADYHRMMQVKPALFDQVLANARNLVARRGDAKRPIVVVQFLLDRQNFGRMVDMYEIARGLGVDVVAINTVLEIPLDRIDRGLLLRPEDREEARPLLTEILRRDKGHGILQVNFGVSGWAEMVAAAEREAQHSISTHFESAPSFSDDNGGCFFAWYSTAITGNGNMSPCCLLLRPGREPVGNILESSLQSQWNGPGYTQMRKEMRQVLLEGQGSSWNPQRFKILDQACVQPHACWLKNVFFRWDEEFYRELKTTLAKARRKESRWTGTPDQRRLAQQRFRVAHPRFEPVLRKVLDWSRPLRHWWRTKRQRRAESLTTG
ncbi:MAG: radical SAM protein [Thermoanaerobaculia bacterium]